MNMGATVLSSADRTLCFAAERQGLHIADPLSQLGNIAAEAEFDA